MKLGNLDTGTSCFVTSKQLRIVVAFGTLIADIYSMTA
jgi:hypothetical protein